MVGFLLAITALNPNLEAAASNLTLQKENSEKPYALIFGTVWGPDDAPVSGVRVNIRRQNEKKTRWVVYSDHNGEFAQRVPAGKADYVLWADPKSHVSGNRLRPGDPVTIHLEYDERADTSLHLK